MPSDKSFDHFYANVSCKSEGLNQCFQESKEVGLQVWRWVLVHQPTPNLPMIINFRRVYYEAIDLIISTIYQESFRCYIQMETLLVKAANGDDYEADFKFLEASFSKDVDTGALPGHATQYFGGYVKEKISCFDEIQLVVSKFPEPEKKLHCNSGAQTICMPTVNPGTSAAGKRAFSSARRLKTWLPSRMGDLAVGNSHKRRTDSVSIADITGLSFSP